MEKYKESDVELMSILLKLQEMTSPIRMSIGYTAVDERFKKLKARRTSGGNAGSVGEHGAGNGTERYNSPEEGQRDTNTTGAAERIAELMREAEQREQSRERTSLKERIEANKRIVAEREREKEKSRQHNRGMSR